MWSFLNMSCVVFSILSVCSTANWPAFQTSQLAFQSCVISQTCCRWSTSWQNKQAETNGQSITCTLHWYDKSNICIKNYYFKVHCYNLGLNSPFHVLAISSNFFLYFVLLRQLTTNTIPKVTFSGLPVIMLTLYKIMARQHYIMTMNHMQCQTCSSVPMLLDGGCSILKNASPWRMVLSSLFRVFIWLRNSSTFFKADLVLSEL